MALLSGWRAEKFLRNHPSPSPVSSVRAVKCCCDVDVGPVALVLLLIKAKGRAELKNDQLPRAPLHHRPIAAPSK